MKIETPQILWNSEGDKGINAALYSVALVQSGFAEDEFGQQKPSHVLATAGNCPDIHLWKVVWADAPTNTPIVAGGRPTQIDFLCRLSRHEGSVNSVNFSPDGLTLATAGETGAVVLWSVPLDKRGNDNGRHFWSSVTREQDLNLKIMARSTESVMDLSWSADSQRLMAGSIDGVIHVFQQNSDGWQQVHRTREHTHYVQGVAYDPLGVYLASMSNDRSVRVYTRKPPTKGKKKVHRKDAKAEGPVPSAEFSQRVAQLLNEARLDMHVRSKQIKHVKQQRATTSTTNDDNCEAASINHKLFCDEATLSSFFRRLCFTPVDGAFLVLPACLWPKSNGPLDEAAANEAPAHAVCLFARHRFDEPYKVLTGLERVRRLGHVNCCGTSLYLPPFYSCILTYNPGLLTQPAVAVVPNPVLFQHVPTDQENQPHKLPYRCILAVLQQDAILIYDTVQPQPLAILRGLHYANLTDAVWSSDGHSLVVSSTDGYASLVRFAVGELGQVYERPVPVKEVVASETMTVEETPIPSCRVPQPPSGLLPPCEQGTATVLEGRPAKKVKRVVPTTVCAKRKEEVPSVEDLSLVEPKKKKRIQPTLLMTSSRN